MRMRLAKLICAAIVGTMGFVSPVVAFAQGSAEEIIVDKLDLKDADMVTATRMLTQKTGLQFLIEPSDNPLPRITLSLGRVTADDALRYICQAAGCQFRRDPNGVYIISRKASGETTPVNPTTTVNPKTVRGPLVAKKFKLLKADARDVLGIMKYGDNYVPRDMLNELNNRLRTPTSLGGPNPALQVFGNMNTPMDSRNVRSGAENGGDIVLPGEGAGQDFGGPGGGFGGGRGGGGQGLGAGGGQGGGGIGGGGQGGNVNLQGGQGLVPQSIDFISYDPTDNSIIVRGTDEDIAELQRYITMFDVAPKQVIIKVEFVTTSSSDAKALGFDWLYERGTIFAGNRPGSFARAGDPIFLNYATGNITSRMRALVQSGQGRVVQAPVIRTLNNQPATVANNVTTTLFLTSLVSIGNGQIIRSPQAIQIPVQTVLSVAPRINEDGTVTTFLNVTLQDFGQLRRGPNGEEFPDILSQQIAVVARVKAGETIALGGLTRKADTGSESRFPVLGDLPIIGQFFRSSNRDKTVSELIIFVTPTVIEDDGNLGIGP